MTPHRCVHRVLDVDVPTGSLSSWSFSHSADRRTAEQRSGSVRVDEQPMNLWTASHKHHTGTGNRRSVCTGCAFWGAPAASKCNPVNKQLSISESHFCLVANDLSYRYNQGRIMVLPGPDAWKRLRARRTYICNIDLISVLFLLLPSLLRNVVRIMAERLDGLRYCFAKI